MPIKTQTALNTARKANDSDVAVEACKDCHKYFQGCECAKEPGFKRHIDHESIKPVKQLADEHWKFMGAVIARLRPDITVEDLSAIGYLYKQSMIHGYKHCEQDIIKARSM